MAYKHLKVSSFRALIAFGLLVATFGTVQRSQAQAYYTASKTLDFSSFVGVSAASSDYGTAYKKQNLNFVIGEDATREMGSYGVSIEPRFGHISNSLTTQSYLVGNLKLERAVGSGHWLHPYVIGGAGYGKFQMGSDKDNSIVYAGGGGVDVGVTTHLALKAEWQYQFWDLGSPHTSFNPRGYTGAVVYRFGGGSHPLGR